ncbi:acyl-ACP--UDP-N-acetylglucosamine O-acyltransferase [Seleniivibrio woodruffii]|uniref:Acyl-[acyl-carrier-protein]--UDP-N-acetylglucosamine O-acyltransferase n=1 Tax=Seleniivibrio woodruffii TaxID=1078050 RepID=A0A4R1KED5_9BACT|nr:acyl-ACP--UDP-N-acetylglucosamine O-acyltransferase [Seleniivibrio woodruffii]TCK62440.1 acyl-[acyl-carrier-protein]--UDP-N-acetylglucosamine O-acyltransferase [Seleniivibrio woodruffii]TVZ34442.1 acyl-[acyl-carrier-protein]--UDP-N-acetylglucosamine O-acyltransferase [Seleniivibrio woodruffii]
MIHKDAIVHPSAQIADSAVIEKGAFIGKNCVIGENVIVGYNAVVERDTVVGDGTRVCMNAHIGGDPQDYSFKGEDTKLIIGKNCLFREFSTVHRASTKEDVWETVVGDNCFIMSYAHVAHDCKLANNVTMTSFSALGGHCRVGSFVNMGGFAAAHQFVRIGSGCMIGGKATLLKDAPPFCMLAGTPAELEGLNSVGLKRRGIGPEVRMELKRALSIYMDLTVKLVDLPEELSFLHPYPEVLEFIDFIKDSKRSFVRG